MNHKPMMTSQVATRLGVGVLKCWRCDRPFNDFDRSLSNWCRNEVNGREFLTCHGCDRLIREEAILKREEFDALGR